MSCNKGWKHQGLHRAQVMMTWVLKRKQAESKKRKQPSWKQGICKSKLQEFGSKNTGRFISAGVTDRPWPHCHWVTCLHWLLQLTCTPGLLSTFLHSRVVVSNTKLYRALTSDIREPTTLSKDPQCLPISWNNVFWLQVLLFLRPELLIAQVDI